MQGFGAEDAKVDAMVGDALLKDVQTKAGIDLNYANQRWAQKGLLYINQLIESGREGIGEAVGMLQAMPSYAQSVVVAETNMQRLNVSQTDINAQMAAFAADLNMPGNRDEHPARLEAQRLWKAERRRYTPELIPTKRLICRQHRIRLAKQLKTWKSPNRCRQRQAMKPLLLLSKPTQTRMLKP